MTHRYRFALRAALATLFALATTGARADDPVNGAALYAASCAGCHGSSPQTSNVNRIFVGRNARAAVDAAFSVSRMVSLRPAFPSGGTALADIAAYLGNAPRSLTFASTAVGSTSATLAVTVYASSSSGNAISNLVVSTSGDFARSGGTCGTTVSTSSNCTVLVAFTPTAGGARSGSLLLSHANTLTPIAIALAGTGTASGSPAASISASSLTLASTPVGSTSATQTLTLSNTGTAALNLATLALGGAQAADFAIGGGSTCVAGGSVAPSSSCTVLVNFTPSAAGTRSATLTIAHNAAGSPTSVALSGTGTAVATATLALNATTLDFGSRVVGSAGASQTLTVTNTGGAALSFSAFTLAGTAAADYTRSGTCALATSVAAGGSCGITLAFTPAAVGTRSATLTIASNASNGSAVVGLNGSGTAAAAPALTLSSHTLDFGNQTVGETSAASALTLTNSGTATLVVSGISASRAEFAVTHNCASVAPGGSCTLQTTFAPAGAGAVSGTLAIVSNATSSPDTVNLAGTGVVYAPVLAWTPATTALAFGEIAVGSSSTAQTLTLANTGSAAASLTAITVSGAAPADFTLGNGSCAAGGTLGVGASCTVVLSFVPTAAGTRSATLSVASSGTRPADIVLGGTGAAAAQPALGLTPSALSFSAVSGELAPDQTLTLQNTGSAALQVSAISVGGSSFSLGTAASGGCAAVPFSLLPGQSCAVSVAWASRSAASESGSVLVASNASGGAASVAVTATHSTAAEPAGGGGCSIARGASAFDPLLWLLTLAAGAVLWRRRRHAGSHCTQFGAGAGSSEAALSSPGSPMVRVTSSR